MDRSSVLIIAVLRSPVVANPKVSGICNEIPFSQAKRVAEPSFPRLLSELIFPPLYRKGYRFPTRRLEWKNLSSQRWRIRAASTGSVWRPVIKDS